MKYLSLFSGIEACTVAWHPLGWEPVAFVEFDDFPKAVLKHHYPNVPDLGDVTKITAEDLKKLESSLYSILEHGGVDRRFYLSQRACQGILNRAEKHGKVLPEVLMLALTRIAKGCSQTSSEHQSPEKTSQTKTKNTDDPENG